MARSLQLRRDSQTLSLNDSTYKLQASSPFASTAESTTFTVLITGVTLDAVERSVNVVRRLVRQAAAWNEYNSGSPVWVYTKTCDALTVTAELGATWRKRLVIGGRVDARPVGGQDVAAVPSVLATVELWHNEPHWQRAKPEPVLVGTSNVTTSGNDGRLTSNAAAVTARRITWSSTTGVTVRYHWLAAANNVDFFKIGGTTIKAYWDNTAKRFKIQDNTGTPKTAQSSTYTFTVGQEVEVVFRFNPSTSMQIYVNAVKDGENATGCAFSQADTYTLFEPTATQTIVNAQLWPDGTLSDANCTGLAAYGRPDAELSFLIPPTDTKGTNAVFKCYNVPGTEPAAARAIFYTTGGQDFDKMLLHYSPLRIQTTHLWECESGTLGTATANNVLAAASNGNQARFTPTNTSYDTRVTLAICANPADVAAMIGNFRLWLACYDSAASTNVNLVKWRLTIAGVAEAYSGEKAVAAVSTRSLLDLGELNIPPGAWPDESDTTTTDVVGGTFIALELAAKNLSGSGGGTFDFDAIYLAPREMEIAVTCESWAVASQYLVVDATSLAPAVTSVRDYRQMEQATFGSAVPMSQEFLLEPMYGSAGVVRGFWLRGTAETYFPNDTCDMWLYVAPRWS